ncbi:MAG: serpin family protein, partial [Methanoregula sp.]|nr:serpin family protein [Methanoregula sp.]
SAITYEGARGKTADEIRSVFHLPEEDRIRREGAAEVYERLKDGEGGYTLHRADALWAEKTWSFLPAFTGIAKKYYAAETRNLDFLQDPEGSRAVINAWTENQTAGKIKNLMPAGSIKNATALVLTNAVSFEGSWIREFSENETVKSRFHISPVNGVEVPLMYRGERDTILGYGETDELQVLEMPYSRGENKPVSMLVLLPKSDTLAAAESALHPDGLARIRSSLGYRHVDLYFPKFTLDTSYELSGTLSTMGMPKAFSSGANFSGMDGTENLYLDEVLHTAHAEVSEKGTYAAAATSVWARAAGIEPAYTPSSSGPITPSSSSSGRVRPVTSSSWGGSSPRHKRRTKSR